MTATQATSSVERFDRTAADAPSGALVAAAEGVPLSSWGWPQWSATAALIALSAAATHNTWYETFRSGWTNEESNHILLVPFVFAWLFLVRRGRLGQCRATVGGRWLGVGVAAVGVGLWWNGYWGAVAGPSWTAWRGGPILLGVGALMACAGKDVVVKFLPAFGSLVFLLQFDGPIRQQYAPPMQAVAADITQAISSTLGMDVVRSGNVLDVGGVSVAVAEACNGMRMVITLILAAYVFAFTTPLRSWVRALILVSAPALAIAANVARLVPTVWAYEHFSRGTADLLHNLSGWVMLVGAFAFLTAAVGVMRWAMLPVDEAKAEGSDDPAPTFGGFRRVRAFAPAAILVLCAASLVLGARMRPPVAVEAYFAGAREAVDGVPFRFDDPVLGGTWVGTDVEVPYEVTDTLKPNLILCRRYDRRVGDQPTGEIITLLLVHCRDARGIVFHNPAICYPVQGWQPTAEVEKSWPVSGIRPEPVGVDGVEFQMTLSTFDTFQTRAVSHFVILPGSGLGRDMGAVRESGADPSRRGFGAGQVQVCFDGPAVPAAERDRLTSLFVGHCGGLLRAIVDAPVAPDEGK